MAELRSQLSKEYLSQAMFLLLERKPFEQITVKELCEKAGVSRLTFYRNFESREEIIRNYWDRSFQDYLTKVISSEHPSLREALVASFGLWGQDKDLLNVLSNDHLSEILYQSFSEYLERILEQFGMTDAFDAPSRAFIVGGIFHTLIGWLRTGEETPEEIVDSIARLLSSNALDHEKESRLS